MYIFFIVGFAIIFGLFYYRLGKIEQRTQEVSDILTEIILVCRKETECELDDD